MTLPEAWKQWSALVLALVAAGAWIARAEDAHESAEEWKQRGIRMEKSLDRLDAAWEMRCRSGDYDKMQCEDRGFDWNPRTRGSSREEEEE